MLYGKEIIAQSNITLPSLIIAVTEGTLTALDPNILTPINWKKLEADFQEIIKLSNTSGKGRRNISNEEEEKLSKYISFSKRFEKDIWEKDPTFHIAAHGREIYPRSRIKVVPEQFFKKGKQYQAFFVPWNDLLERLRFQHNRTTISKSQHETIKAGWGIQTMAPYVENALFKKEEVADLITSNKNRKNNSDNATKHTLTDILQKITPDLYHGELAPKEKAAISKSIKQLKAQLPEAFTFCFQIVMESIPYGDRENFISYTCKDIEKRAAERGIKTPMARQIFASLPKGMRK